jgi:hypothetical protein
MQLSHLNIFQNLPPTVANQICKRNAHQHDVLYTTQCNGAVQQRAFLKKDAVGSLTSGGVRCFSSHILSRGKYELRSAVKKLYQLRPEVTASIVSVASQLVYPKHDELHPAVSKEMYH